MLNNLWRQGVLGPLAATNGHGDPFAAPPAPTVTVTTPRRLRHWLAGLFRPTVRALSPVEIQLRAELDVLRGELERAGIRERQQGEELERVRSQVRIHQTEIEMLVAVNARDRARIDAEAARFTIEAGSLADAAATGRAASDKALADVLASLSAGRH